MVVVGIGGGGRGGAGAGGGGSGHVVDKVVEVDSQLNLTGVVGGPGENTTLHGVLVARAGEDGKTRNSRTGGSGYSGGLGIDNCNDWRDMMDDKVGGSNGGPKAGIRYVDGLGSGIDISHIPLTYIKLEPGTGGKCSYNARSNEYRGGGGGGVIVNGDGGPPINDTVQGYTGPIVHRIDVDGEGYGGGGGFSGGRQGVLLIETKIWNKL